MKSSEKPYSYYWFSVKFLHEREDIYRVHNKIVEGNIEQIDLDFKKELKKYCLEKNK